MPKTETVWTHDITTPQELLDRLRKCNGVQADGTVIVWEWCQYLATCLQRLEDLEGLSEHQIRS